MKKKLLSHLNTKVLFHKVFIFKKNILFYVSLTKAKPIQVSFIKDVFKI